MVDVCADPHTATDRKALTGPATILQWSFVRDDQPRKDTCLQIALALRDEVIDLEQAGIAIIQVDEPAIREGLPFQRCEWKAYLRWAVDAFKLATSGVRMRLKSIPICVILSSATCSGKSPRWMPT